MPNFHQYSKFTLKHMVFVKVHFAIDLACVISTSPWESTNRDFSELFRENPSLFCFTIKDALTSEQALKNQSLLGTLLIIPSWPPLNHSASFLQYFL